MNDAVNTQIGNEFGAMLQYVSIAAYLDRESLPAMAAYFYTQADEERMHAMKFVHYVIDAGGKVGIPAIAEPKADFSSAEEAVALSLNWEETVTKQIGSLADLAVKEGDHLTKVFLDWFVTEQLEEVSSMGTLLSIVRRAGPNGLLFVEDYLARQGRLTTTPPAAGG
jgi:ferritin